ILEKVKGNDDKLDLVKVEGGAGKQTIGLEPASTIKYFFNKILMSSSLKPGRNYPDDFYLDGRAREYFAFVNYTTRPLGYWVSKDEVTGADGFPEKTTAIVSHTKLSNDQTAGLSYGLVAGSGIKDIYQNCYNPAKDTGQNGSACGGIGANAAGTSCCKGVIRNEDGTGEKCYKF
ncbi:MAG: hypothetical protein WCV41_04225, partial [Patescibacteria group bacterium]